MRFFLTFLVGLLAIIGIVAAVNFLPYQAEAVAMEPTNMASPNISSGDLIKIKDNPAIYWYLDGKRYTFINEGVFFSWFSAEDFSEVKVISDAVMAAIPLEGNATFRPGTKLVKIQTDPRTYAIEPGGKLRWVKDEATAKALYGSDWNKKIIDLPDYSFSDYEVDVPIENVEYPAGTLLRNLNSFFRVDKIDGQICVQAFINYSAFVGNGFKEEDAIPAEIVYPVCKTDGQSNAIGKFRSNLRYFKKAYNYEDHECSLGDVKKYKCPNKEKVSWCTCSVNNEWDCMDKPEDQCVEPEPEPEQHYAVCGNHVCEEGETESNCHRDCSNHPCSLYCVGRGNGGYRCNLDGTYNGSAGDYFCGCKNDCSLNVCGDGVCEENESEETCANDYSDRNCSSLCNARGTSTYQCNLDGIYSNNYTGIYCSCRNSCELTVCGNYVCEEGETEETCALDCLETPICQSGESKNYVCEDLTEVPWCTCLENGHWQCMTSPEIQCNEPEPRTGPNQKINLLVVIPEDLFVNIVGHECTADNCCTFAGKQFANDADYKGIDINTVPDSGLVNQIVNIGVSNIQAVKDMINQLVDIIEDEVNGAFKINTRFKVVSDTSGLGGMGKFGICGLVAGPNTFGKKVVLPLMDNVNHSDDLVLVYQPTTDKFTGLSVNSGFGANTWNAYEGVGGTSYGLYNVNEYGYALYALLQEFDFALHNFSGVNDIYQDSDYPEGCQSTTVDPYSYFPHPAHCTNDPDYADCGQTSCVGGAENFYRHILNTHYNPKPANVIGHPVTGNYFIGNQCRDGKQDFGETGIDTGGPCS